MSVNYNDQVFLPDSDKEMAKFVASALQKDFRKGYAAVKRIERTTKARTPTIRNWYEGRNAPSARHLLLLAKSSPALIKFILIQIGGEELWEIYRLFSRLPLKGNHSAQIPAYSDKNVPLNVPLKLNERQKWFLLLLQNGENGTAESIASTWQVSLKTARRNIRDLKEAGIIRFVGAKKTGHYEIVRHR